MCSNVLHIEIFTIRRFITEYKQDERIIAEAVNNGHNAF